MTEPVPDPNLGRPSVDDVALLIRARTKDSQGNEVGTFDDDTRPTGDDVEKQIDASMSLVGSRCPPPHELPVELVPAFANLVAYRAALRVEKSYFPEQVRSNRSAYDELRQEYLDDLAAFLEAVAAGGTEEHDVLTRDFASLPVRSWTSLPNRWIMEDV
jgi:hypothetical protein